MLRLRRIRGPSRQFLLILMVLVLAVALGLSELALSVVEYPGLAVTVLLALTGLAAVKIVPLVQSMGQSRRGGLLTFPLLNFSSVVNIGRVIEVNTNGEEYRRRFIHAMGRNGGRALPVNDRLLLPLTTFSGSAAVQVTTTVSVALRTMVKTLVAASADVVMIKRGLSRSRDRPTPTTILRRLHVNSNQVAMSIS